MIYFYQIIEFEEEGESENLHESSKLEHFQRGKGAKKFGGTNFEHPQEFRFPTITMLPVF